MEDKSKEIKKGITIHRIKTEGFKTDFATIFLTTKLERENVTQNAMIPMVLKMGSKNLENEEEINKTLEDMYGASFDCGIDKTGDNQVLKFYLESINGKYLPNEEEILDRVLNTLIEIVFAPKIQNDAFMKEYVDSSKQKLKILIEGVKDNKAQYASLRCMEEMFKDTPFGLFKYGYIEDLKNIDEKSIYEHYKKLISECKIDIFVSGNIDEEKVLKLVSENENIQNLNERDAIYNKKGIKGTKHNAQEIIENADVVQGNLVLGLSIGENTKKEKYVAIVYNAILGGTATSKMFQIVREKYSLAYTAGSSYLRHKNTIFIRCGIEIKNYEKALDIIKEQIEDMKKGNFTEENIENAKVRSNFNDKIYTR